MVKKMFRIVELEDCKIKQYVFLTDAESVESQLDRLCQTDNIMRKKN